MAIHLRSLPTRFAHSSRRSDRPTPGTSGRSAAPADERGALNTTQFGRTPLDELPASRGTQRQRLPLRGRRIRPLRSSEKSASDAFRSLLGTAASPNRPTPHDGDTSPSHRKFGVRIPWHGEKAAMHAHCARPCDPGHRRPARFAPTCETERKGLRFRPMLRTELPTFRALSYNKRPARGPHGEIVACFQPRCGPPALQTGTASIRRARSMDQNLEGLQRRGSVTTGIPVPDAAESAKPPLGRRTFLRLTYGITAWLRNGTRRCRG